MKRIHLTLLSFLIFFPGGISPLRAQVTVEIEMGQEQFLRNESLPMRVRVTNRSGQTLELGKDQHWLRFTITKRDGKIASKLGPVPIAGQFTLLSSQSKDRVFDLMPYYNLVPGRYQVVATVYIRDWNNQFSSKANSFEVVKGVKIWEQTVGIPQAQKNHGPPELRRYVLLQARYLKSMYLYARVTGDTDNKVYRVSPLGEVVNFVPVQHRVDRESRLHVLFQNGSRSFNYSVVDPNGSLIKRQRHDYHGSRPSLKSDEDGRILVVGGIRRLAPTDFPATKLPGITNEVEKPSP